MEVIKASGKLYALYALCALCNESNESNESRLCRPPIRPKTPIVFALLVYAVITSTNLCTYSNFYHSTEPIR